MYPHVHECKYCKVCIPDHMLQEEQPQEQLTAADARRSLLQHSTSGSSGAGDASSSQEDAEAPLAGREQHSSGGSSAAAAPAHHHSVDHHHDLDLSELDEMSEEDLKLLSAVLPGWALQRVEEYTNLTLGDARASRGLGSKGSSRGSSSQSVSRRRLSYIEGVKDVSSLEYKIAPRAEHLWGQQGSKQCVVCHGCNQVCCRDVDKGGATCTGQTVLSLASIICSCAWRAACPCPAARDV